MTPYLTPMLPSRIGSKLRHDPTTNCWLWTAALDRKGYPIIRWDGRNRRAHRLIRTLLLGPIPEGHDLHHTCHVRHCCNPDHARPITKQEHGAEHAVEGTPKSRGVPRPSRRKTECLYGHDMTDEANVYTKPSTGERECRTCRAAKRAARRTV